MVLEPPSGVYSCDAHLRNTSSISCPVGAQGCPAGTYFLPWGLEPPAPPPQGLTFLLSLQGFRQSSSFRLLQEALEAEEKGGTPAFLPSLLSPQSSLPTSRALATPPKLHTCEKCGTSIVNHAVRIQEGRYRHPGCYSCADCGLNLKMRGHFWVGDELYCEKHARQRYSSPPTLSSQA